MSVYHESPTKVTTPAQGLFPHCYCVCQQGSPYRAMCGHVQTDEPNWRPDIPADTCHVCIEMQWATCVVCGMGPA